MGLVASLRGRLIIASPRVMDPNFRRAVVLVTEHSDRGAMGVVLNRPSDTTVDEVVPDLVPLVDGDEVVHVGGPVASTSVVVLAEFDDPSAAALLVDGDLGFVPAEAAERESFAEVLRRRRVFAGHSGWGPGQLEAELEDEDWIITDAARDDVFAGDTEALWSTVLKRLGRDYALLTTMPNDPSLN
jgi:putative transcriptional regulator